VLPRFSGGNYSFPVFPLRIAVAVSLAERAELELPRTIVIYRVVKSFVAAVGSVIKQSLRSRSLSWAGRADWVVIRNEPNTPGGLCVCGSRLALCARLVR